MRIIFIFLLYSVNGLAAPMTQLTCLGAGQDGKPCIYKVHVLSSAGRQNHKDCKTDDEIKEALATQPTNNNGAVLKIKEVKKNDKTQK